MLLLEWLFCQIGCQNDVVLPACYGCFDNVVRMVVLLEWLPEWLPEDWLLEDWLLEWFWLLVVVLSDWLPEDWLLE